MIDAERCDRRRFLAARSHRLGLRRHPAAADWRRLAQTARSRKPQRIDMHHHFAPPAWVAEVKGRPLLQPANTAWTPAKSIDDMDRGGVAAAVVSITNPGLWFGDAAVDAARWRARATSTARSWCRTIPARFGSVRRDAAARRRRDAEGDRLRLRHAQGRRRRAVHELRRHVARQPGVPAGDGGAQPAQGGRPRASDRGELLPESRLRARRRAGQHGVRHRHDARDHGRRLSAAMPRAFPTSASSGRMPAARRRFWPAASTARRATPRIGCRTASCTS